MKQTQKTISVNAEALKQVIQASQALTNALSALVTPEEVKETTKETKVARKEKPTEVKEISKEKTTTSKRKFSSSVSAPRLVKSYLQSKKDLTKTDKSLLAYIVDIFDKIKNTTKKDKKFWNNLNYKSLNYACIVYIKNHKDLFALANNLGVSTYIPKECTGYQKASQF